MNQSTKGEEVMYLNYRLKQFLLIFIFMLSSLLNNQLLRSRAQVSFSNEHKTREYILTSITSMTKPHESYVPTIMGERNSAFHLISIISIHDTNKIQELISALYYALIKNIDMVKNHFKPHN